MKPHILASVGLRDCQDLQESSGHTSGHGAQTIRVPVSPGADKTRDVEVWCHAEGWTVIQSR